MIRGLGFFVLCLCVGTVGVYTMALLWESEDRFQESVFSSQHLDSRWGGLASLRPLLVFFFSKVEKTNERRREALEVSSLKQEERNEAQPGSCPEFRGRIWVPGGQGWSPQGRGPERRQMGRLERHRGMEIVFWETVRQGCSE